MFLCAGLVPYLAVRGSLELAGTRATSSTYLAGRPLLPAPLWVMGWGLWNGLRLGWVPIVLVAAAPAIGRTRRAWLSLALLTTGLNLVVADDVSRSASVAVPLLVATALLLWQEQRARAHRLLPLLCAGNLLLPAQHIIAAPGTAAAWHSVPVLSLTAEWDRVKHPPDFANPDTYHRRSLDHLQSGNRTRARTLNEIALRLDPRHARSIAQRGILLFLDGHHAEGLAELDRALALAPRLFDARMQRAAFRHQLSDPAGALADVREALQTMPADWPARKDAEQFERNLAKRIGR